MNGYIPYIYLILSMDFSVAISAKHIAFVQFPFKLVPVAVEKLAYPDTFSGWLAVMEIEYCRMVCSSAFLAFPTLIFNGACLVVALSLSH